MELSYEKLVQFDLVEELESKLMKSGKTEKLFAFFEIVQNIRSVDEFIKDSPSFPGSTDKIIRDEMVSGIGATLAIEGTRLGPQEIEESFRKATLSEKLERKEQEAENSRQVYRFIVDLVLEYEDPFQYSESIIKQIHKLFLPT